MPGEQGAVTVRYWAGARAAAGVDEDALHGCPTVADAAVAVVSLHSSLAAIVPVSTWLLDGRAVPPHTALDPGSILEVLPPFAGG